MFSPRKFLIAAALIASACADAESPEMVDLMPEDDAAAAEQDGAVTDEDGGAAPTQGDAQGNDADVAQGDSGSEADPSSDAGSASDPTSDAGTSDGSSSQDAETDASSPRDAGQIVDASAHDADDAAAAARVDGSAGPLTPDASTPDASSPVHTPDASEPPACLAGCLSAFTASEPSPSEPLYDPNATGQARFLGIERAIDLGRITAPNGTVRISAHADSYQDSDWFKFKIDSVYRYFDFFWGTRTGAHVTRQFYISCAPEAAGCAPMQTSVMLFGKEACSLYNSTAPAEEFGEYAYCEDPTVYIRVVSFADAPASYTINLDIRPLANPRNINTRDYPQRNGYVP